MLEQADISLKGLNIDKLKAEYQKLMKQKSELTSTYKNCEKEVRELKRKQENLNQYLGRTQPDPAQEQQEKVKSDFIIIQGRYPTQDICLDIIHLNHQVFVQY